MSNEGGNELHAWMERRRVKATELAKRLDITPQYLGLVKQGKQRPSDELKWKIEDVTREMEREDGVETPVGVAATSWLVRPAVTA